MKTKTIAQTTAFAWSRAGERNEAGTEEGRGAPVESGGGEGLSGIQWSDAARALWERVRAYTPDEPVAWPFSARLAQENGWSAEEAKAVIEEYKRFAFLALVAGHPVTPSDAVDQAWHLHLLYTRAYWDDFCGRVLGRPLHHEPTKGGSTERGKFVDWYETTLGSYRRWFGEDPPAAIWPASGRRFDRQMRFERVNVARHWLVPKPAEWSAWIGQWAGWRQAALVVIVAGCLGAGGGTTWSAGGTETSTGDEAALGRALAIWCVGVVLACLWKVHLSGPNADAKASRDQAGRELTPLSLAYLAGGERRAFDAAVAGLVEAGALGIERGGGAGGDPEGTRLVPGDGAVETLGPFERAIHSAVGGGVVAGEELERVRTSVRPLLALVEEDLIRRGLWLTREQRLARTWWPMIALALAGLLAGTAAGWPSFFEDFPGPLLLAGIVVMLGVAVVLKTGGARTRRGHRLIVDRRSQFASRDGSVLPATPAFLAVALFGLTAAGVGKPPGLKEALRTRRDDSGGGGCGATACGVWSSEGSSEGGGGCGGDGGGGCGGGCGGCGG